MIKKIYVILTVLVSTTFFAQKVISEIPFTKDKSPLRAIYLPNLDRLVIQNGVKTNKVYGNIIKDINSFDADGFVEKMVANEELVNCIFSPIENAFLIGKKPENNAYPEEYKLVLDGRPSKYFKLKTGFRYFNDIYGFNLLNQKNEFKIDLQKDDLFLNVVDIFSSDSQKYKLEKPDLFRLQNKFTTEYKEGLNYDVRINESNIGIITKSINKNYKSATLYRTIYGLTGERLDDIKYIVDVPKNYLIYSNNGGGVINRNDDSVQISELAINNFIVDKETQDVYIYGLFGNEGKAANNLKNIPLGLYVFKFNKSGKLIWESVNDIVDILGFNQPQEIQNINLNLKLQKNELLVSVNSQNNDGYLNFVTLDIGNGSKVLNGKMNGLSKINKSNDDGFIKADYQTKELPNKNIDNETIIASQINPAIFNYIKNVKSKETISFKTYISKKGYWVVETDNINYCKILFFS